MKSRASGLAPVLVLGGDCTALSVARNLGRRGISVYAINEPGAPVRHSRYCRFVPTPWLGTNEDSWASYLLSTEAEPLRGAVLLAASDDALETIAHNRE